MQFGKGALSDAELMTLCEHGGIVNAESKNISPASLDLTLSEEVYEIQGLLLPKQGEPVRGTLELMAATKVSVEKPLQAGKMYLFRLQETLNLPEDIYGYCNPKSSTGRLDTHVRVLADGVPRYDSISPRGYSGELWLAVYPQSFSLQVHVGTPLTQLRLFTADTRLTDKGLEREIEENKLLWHPIQDESISYQSLGTHDQDGGLLLTAYITEGVVGYKCIADGNLVIDVAKVNHYNAKDFFSPIYAEGEVIRLSRDSFYILSGAERVRIPPTLASEMVPMDERSGDFRSHYAGFLDPGWGWGSDGEGKGRPFTLEVRPFEDIVIRKEQPIAKIRFEKMSGIPQTHYDSKASNYLGQAGPKLAKQFNL